MVKERVQGYFRAVGRRKAKERRAAFDRANAALQSPEAWSRWVVVSEEAEVREVAREFYAAHHTRESLLTKRGSDLNNRLLGVLLRFWKEPDMFHCFIVHEDHRDFLHFLWFRNNDPDSDIVNYRMRMHVFGNSPSPAVTIGPVEGSPGRRREFR
ncbi:hypothetical protein SKAU_G00232980 [Synaphobranchus kaupii]|uniref:Uncharacterized protein n=1 Tax=Synaphobranchus kaupii TaxID=118154 RepID=A0A9Q1IT58_SYNKA|nr:hypothetical protein SKAU_G00232980 [Synaphobranchus kaupii]